MRSSEQNITDSYGRRAMSIETLFDQCMGIVRRALKVEVSEVQYHHIVDCIRYVGTARALEDLDPAVKKRILAKYGLREQYDPFEDPSHIRFHLSFNNHDEDAELQNLLNDFDTVRQEYSSIHQSDR